MKLMKKMSSSGVERKASTVVCGCPMASVTRMPILFSASLMSGMGISVRGVSRKGMAWRKPDPGVFAVGAEALVGGAIDMQA